MGNCLVTKLKAVVNNPDLPVIETMQQFTLDAIASSNNPSMTDGQKYALNHFFYQIGAISNSGIYAKMAYIGLPMIAGNVAGALNNYVGNVAYTLADNRVTLTNHMLKATVDGDVQLGYNTLPKTLTIKSNITLFAGVKLASSTLVPLFDTKDNSNQRTYFYMYPGHEFGINNIPYTQYSTAMKYSQLAINKGCVISGQTSKGWYYDLNDSTLKEKTMTVSEPLLSDPTSTFQLIALKSSLDSGLYYVVVGDALTESEISLLAKALVDLKAAFVS